MNLAKHDAETDMKMDMTPMIDVVFNLIIFFMIITDLTQQDLEELQLPMAKYAVEDKPPPDQWRPILNVQYDGKIIVKRDVLYDPEVDANKADPYEKVKQWLASAALRMKKEYFDPEGKTGPLIPDEPLLIRADETTPFKHVQKIMEFCGVQNIMIWKVQLACSVPDENKSDK